MATGDHAGYKHSYTFLAGQMPLDMVRSCRKTCHDWKIHSTLRLKDGTYHLEFSSPTKKGLAFARHMYETGVAIWVLPGTQVLQALLKAMETADPPVEHLQ